MKNILITGSNGFVGKNMIAGLLDNKEINIFKYDIKNSDGELEKLIEGSDIIMHFAGINRPEKLSEFEEGNYHFTKHIIDILNKLNKNIPIIMTSSIQAELDNPYGKSKKKGEEILIQYAKQSKSNIYIYRLPNLFGKWSKPNYNSVVATFCYNISRNLPIKISDRTNNIEILYIDDVIKEFLAIINDEKIIDGYYYSIDKSFSKNLGEISDLIMSFKKSRVDLILPNLSDDFTKYLYSTYLSYLDVDSFSYNLNTRIDDRGGLAEIIKSKYFGQIFFSYTKPGITRGNHYHHTKVEKFCVLKGTGLIKFRNIITNEVIKYTVSGNELKIVDIPPGYTHSIKNSGNNEMLTLFWAVEIFNQDNPDTFYEEV